MTYLAPVASLAGTRRVGELLLDGARVIAGLGVVMLGLRRALIDARLPFEKFGRRRQVQVAIGRPLGRHGIVRPEVRRWEWPCGRSRLLSPAPQGWGAGMFVLRGAGAGAGGASTVRQDSTGQVRSAGAAFHSASQSVSQSVGQSRRQTSLGRAWWVGRQVGRWMDSRA